MAQWKGKTRGGKLGYRAFVFILRYLGIRTAYFVLIFVAFYFIPFAPKATRHSYRFFRLRLGWGRLASCWAVYRTYYSFGQVLLDRVAILAGLGDRYSFDFDGEEHLVELVKQGKGSVLFSGHLGNWEVAGNFLGKRLPDVNKVHAVMLDVEHEQIKEYLDKVKQKAELNIIAIKKDFSHLFQIKDAVANNEPICIHGDRFVDGAKTIEVDFLGAKAHFPVGPFYLATRLKIPYSLVFAMKERSTHYHFYATPSEVQSGNPEVVIQKFAKRLEELVRQYPYQWFNFYDFWASPETDTKEKTNAQPNPTHS